MGALWWVVCLLFPVPPARILLSGCAVITSPRSASALFKISFKGRVFGVQNPRYFPAPPLHKWSASVCGDGVAGNRAVPSSWARRTPTTGTVLLLTGGGGSCLDNRYAKLLARSCTIHSALQRVCRYQSLALGNTINQYVMQGKRRRCDVRPASGLRV